MIQDCYSRPGDLYRRLCAKLGKSFNLRDYWGPLTSLRATDWIAAATAELLTSGEAPDLLLTYLPHLDYEFQKNGPEGPRAAAVFAELEIQVARLVATARAVGYEVLVWGDYAITPATRPVYPNRVLLEAGCFAVRDIRGRLYPDLHATPAFALVDHQVAHVHLRNPSSLPAILEVLQDVPGIARVTTAAEAGIDHPCAGDLVLAAEPGAWFAYPWWARPSQAPDFAGHVDIHNKPGFDPCELFFAAWPPFSVSQDATRIRGTHGLADAPEHDVFWGSTLPDLQAQEQETLLDGAHRLRRRLISAAHERPQ
jgi:predicted AlkP superfamily pyrophosphatase or phosphodiesterase